MEFTKQKRMACLPTSIFMLNENKNYGKIKKLCKKRFGHSVCRRRGCDISGVDDVVKLLEDLGFDKPNSITDGSFKTLSRITRYRRALIMPYMNDPDHGHAVAWDGYKIYDPTDGIMTDEQFLKEYNGWTYMIILLKTPIIERIMNAFKQPFFEIWNS